MTGLQIKNLLCLFLCLKLCMATHAKQHPVIAQIANQTECGTNFYLSWSEINSDSKSQYIQKQFRAAGINTTQNLIGSLNLLPVNRCVLRGNRRFGETERLKELERMGVKTFIRFTQSSAKKNEMKNLVFWELPISGSGYPKGASKQAILKALEQLAKAEPSQRVYLSCFFGKHRTGLIAALYQFTRDYALSPVKTCIQKATPQDRAFRQMNSIAALDFYTYDMPYDFRRFYKEYTEAVCKESSQEFFNY